MSAPGLAAKALRGVRWNYIGAVGRIAATFVSQIVMARLLGPESFGLFAYAALTVTLSTLIVEMGLQSALVQVAELDDDVVAIACGRLLLTGSLGALAVFWFAEAIAVHIFAAPAAAPVLRTMAPTIVIGTMTAAATALISRDIEFKTIQLAALGSYIVGYLVCGVGAALLGMGVWSLVIAWHVQTVIACAILAIRSPRRLTFANPLRKLPIARFGFVVMATHMANWTIDNGPHTAIGRWLGAASLGMYSIANNLVKVPADHLVRNLQTVLHPLASRSTGNDAGMRRAYITVLVGVGLLACPTFAFVAQMAEPVVAVLLGQKWMAAAEVLVPLSLAMILHALEALAGPTLSGRGEPRVELQVKLIMLPLTIGMLAVTAQWSLAAVGWGVAGVYLVRLVWMNAALGRRLGISLALLARCLTGSLLLAAIGWTVPSAFNAGLDAANLEWSAAVELAIAAVVTAGVILAVTWLLPQVVLGRYPLSLLHTLFEKRPSLAARPGLRRLTLHAARAADALAADPDGAVKPWTRQPKTSL